MAGVAYFLNNEADVNIMLTKASISEMMEMEMV